jgi:predicted DsbA family dithiol-disulfide isomerase
LFDRIQRAHALEARNIADREVLASCARDVGLDLPRWGDLFDSEETERAVWGDIEEAARLGIHAVPTVLLPDGTRISGAVPEASYMAHLATRSPIT